MAFEIDPRLADDTIMVKSFAFCQLLVMNDERYPWAILVPRIEGARELHDLSDADGAGVWQEVLGVAKAISTWLGVEKVNIGALGNVVSQLHIHIVGRHAGDPAWPGPVWGHSPREAYKDPTDILFVAHLERTLLGEGSRYAQDLR
jgi:diadenosine tetraphosphate (Ap4A) HIT family hydrolase